ncbi:RNA polymerase sigma-70 factor [Kitasatospora sp. NPDC052896]|uniref:RNA polymerase sigma-70 factor n=1 Tax=Kitasatospora sp. NPDC052896 TaxID=3364061 RepID=UPI0037C9122A
MIDSATAQDATDPFLQHRRLLFGTAYRMLGSVAETEDILQDTWLRWSAVDRASVANPKAYLVKAVTNLAINRLRSAQLRREAYLGPWLPEPLLTAPDTAEEAVLADSVSTALLVVLETLGPVERAVFVLREVFGYAHAEIAEVLGRPEPAVRQIAHRAKAHVRERRPRYDTDPEQRRRVTERFMAACAGGDLSAVLELLAPDVVAWSDGGGIVSAARRPLYGPDHVARWLLGVLAKPAAQGIVAEPAEVNGQLGVVFSYGGAPAGALTLDLVDGRIQALRAQLNPEKLAGLRPSAG